MYMHNIGDILNTAAWHRNSASAGAESRPWAQRGIQAHPRGEASLRTKILDFGGLD